LNLVVHVMQIVLALVCHNLTEPGWIMLVLLVHIYRSVISICLFIVEHGMGHNMNFHLICLLSFVSGLVSHREQV
jgi:hypothetical protein